MATTLPSTTHVREVWTALTEAGFVLVYDGLAEYPSNNRTFDQKWRRADHENVTVSFDKRGYINGYATGRAGARTHGRSHRQRAFTPRMCVDLLAKNAREDQWHF